MNWVGGARRRVGLQNEKKTQKEYFERKRQNKKIQAFQSPEKKNGISQDLLALHTVNIAYSGIPFDKRFPEKRYVRKVNIDQSKLFSREIQEVELPHSPIKTPSKLNLEETNSCLISSKLTSLNKSSNEKETSNENENHGMKGKSNALLSQSYQSFLNFPANKPHQPTPEQLFNKTLLNKTNEISSLSLLDNCSSVERTQRNLDRYQPPSFLPSMDLYPSTSPECSASPPRYAVLPESQQIPRGSISNVYNNIQRKWREQTKSIHTETYIEERQHCWQSATSQRSYISKNTSPFITTLHQLQETRPYRYHEFVCPESPEEYVAIPLDSVQQLYMPSAQTERVRTEQETPVNTQEHFTDKSILQISKQTSDFWQIPVYGDFVKEMKIKQSQVADSLMLSTDQSTNIETQEDAFAKNVSRENRKENCETPLMLIQKFNEDQEDPVFNEQISYQMSPESQPYSKLVNVSVQADLKASVNDASTSPILWPPNDQASQCDDEEFRLSPTEQKHENSLQGTFEENSFKLSEGTSKNLETCYQLRSRSAAKATYQK